MTQTEFSYFWDGTTQGDALLSPHSSDVFANLWAILMQSNTSSQGVIETDHSSFFSQLIVTNPAGNNIRVANGAALVNGRVYTNTANIDNTIETPSLGTRIDRVILRTTFASQIIRIAIISGKSGAGTPTIQQNADVWEIPLALVSITIGGVITITDERVFAKTQLRSAVPEAYTVLGAFTSTGIELVAEFTDISQEFKDLLIIGMCRHIDNTGVGGETEWATLGVRFNNDNEIIYNSAAEFNRIATGGAQTLNIEGLFNQTFSNGFYIATDDAPANHFSPVVIQISDYSDTDFFKTLLIESSVWGGAAGRPSAYHNVNTVYRKITGISNIELFNPDAPTVAWVSGTRFMLIGLQ